MMREIQPTASDDSSCIFCAIAQGKIPSTFVGESNNFFAVRDINPLAHGHTLIIPKRHFVTLLDIPNVLGEELLSFMKQMAGELLDKKLGDGFNILMRNLKVAGQEVMHAHIHLVPRNEDDGIRGLPV